MTLAIQPALNNVVLQWPGQQRTRIYQLIDRFLLCWRTDPDIFLGEPTNQGLHRDPHCFGCNKSHAYLLQDIFLDELHWFIRSMYWFLQIPSSRRPSLNRSQSSMSFLGSSVSKSPAGVSVTVYGHHTYSKWNDRVMGKYCVRKSDRENHVSRKGTEGDGRSRNVFEYCTKTFIKYVASDWTRVT